jgi:hypothetical protein
MVAAVETLGDGELTEAAFGRFNDLDAGWYWKLTITRLVTSEHPNLRRGGEDTLERRTRLVVGSWKRHAALYEQDFTPKAEGE